jgi:hypothetical protein
MDEKQYDLFPEEAEKSMEQESEDSTGLSIVPYLAVSAETGSNLPVQSNRNEWKKLSKEQKYYVRNENKYSYKRLVSAFEKRNGYPLSWQWHHIKDAFYRERGEITYKMEITHHALIVKKNMYLPPVRRSHNERSNIIEYSMKSRKRFFEALLTMDWVNIPQDTIRELTLTYPSIYPNDGKILKKHLDAYAKRLKNFGKAYGGIAFPWKMEFQKRGAPHFHLILISGNPIPLEELRTWALKSWNNLVAKWIASEEDHSEEEKKIAIKNHRNAGIEADIVRKNAKGLVCYVAWYIGKNKGKAKEYQHEVPQEYENVGRWWGFYGKNSGLLKIGKREIVISEEEYEEYKEKIQRKWELEGRHYRINERRISCYEL